MTDPWPRRNLGRGEHWGRTVEKRVDGLITADARQSQSTAGTSRYSASTTGTLEQNAEALTRALESTPRYFANASSASGFGFGGDNWLTVSSQTIANPGGYSRAEVSAVGTCSSRQPGSVATRFSWPFSLSDVSSEYGPRPPLPFHNGIDFSYSGIDGDPVPAAHDGAIILRSYYPDWGNYVRIDCSDLTGVAGSWTGYAHMNAPGLYGPGTSVSRGQTIGYVGNTGLSTGPHLHYETAPGGTRMDPRDFMDIFGGASYSLLGVEARIVINGVASPTFQPYTEMGISQNQTNYPIFGRSLSDPPSITVELQMRTPGGAIPPDAGNLVQLTVRGGFQHG